LFAHATYANEDSLALNNVENDVNVRKK
jgi:hypothetical protein